MLFLKMQVIWPEKTPLYRYPFCLLMSKNIQILDHYKDTISHLLEEASSPVQKVHVGEDLLTRERFTGAKGLRSGCATEKERFDHLHPITFEIVIV
jgi:hypothetical protein